MSEATPADRTPAKSSPGKSSPGKSSNDELTNGVTYADSGVDIVAADQAVERIKAKVRSTFRPEVIGDIGGFGGLFAFDKDKYDEPILVSGTDGVGTKSLIAQMTGRYTTIGMDLVAMVADDLVCSGAETLFILDYISTGKLDPAQIEDLVEGVARGCRQAGAALVGGEISEHPGIMEAGEFDLVGFAVGVVDRARMLRADLVQPDDVIIGLPSPGLRSNGYSLARKVLLEVGGRSLDDPAWEGAERTLADELLEPSVIYCAAVHSLLDQVAVHAIAHITGGGLVGNIPRVLPNGVTAQLDSSNWERPGIFDEIQRVGQISSEEMYRVFNMGIGMVVIVAAGDAEMAIDHLRLRGHRATQVGVVAASSSATSSSVSSSSASSDAAPTVTVLSGA